MKQRNLVMRRLRRENLSDDRGATAVEFALVFPVILMVIFFALYGARGTGSRTSKRRNWTGLEIFATS